MDTPDPSLQDQILSLKPTVSELVFARVEVLVAQLGDDRCKGASVCVTDDGACLHWPGRGIFCEVFDTTVEDKEAFFINVFSLRDSALEYSRTASTTDDACNALRTPIHARQQTLIFFRNYTKSWILLKN